MLTFTSKEKFAALFVSFIVLTGAVVTWIDERSRGFAPDFLSLEAVQSTGGEVEGDDGGYPSDSLSIGGYGTGSSHHSSTVNINDASPRTLQQLPGIGPALSRRIVEYRIQYGEFVVPEHIMAVKGIGEKTYERIKELITVD
jgi:competence ComEA-like helix-hairpin-helix protein